MWIHIDFTFKSRDGKHRKNYYLNNKKERIFHKFIKKMISYISEFTKIKRKFFLYEPKPHCFLALEIKQIPDNFDIQDFILPKFVKSISWRYAKDESNGKLFLDSLDKMTNVILSYSKKSPPWLKSFPPRQRLFAHILHCSMNSLLNSRVKELKFYRHMIKCYRKGLSKDAKSKYHNLFFKSF